MSNSFTRLIREPLVQFLLIGTGIYALYFLYGEAPLEEQERTIVITSDYVSSLNESFAKRWNRPPTDEEMQGLVVNIFASRCFTVKHWRWAWIREITSSAADLRRNLSFSPMT